MAVLTTLVRLLELKVLAQEGEEGERGRGARGTHVLWVEWARRATEVHGGGGGCGGWGGGVRLEACVYVPRDASIQEAQARPWNGAPAVSEPAERGCAHCMSMNEPHPVHAPSIGAPAAHPARCLAGTGSLEMDQQLLEAASKDGAGSATGGSALSARERHALLYRMGQKALTRDYLLYAKRLLEREMQTLRVLMGSPNAES